MPLQGGVVLGADTRATEGETVCDKNCEKIHYIADNIWCCGAGTSADTESTTALISSQLELHRMATQKQPRVITALTMLKKMLFRYQGAYEHAPEARLRGRKRRQPGIGAAGARFSSLRALLLDVALRCRGQAT